MRIRPDEAFPPHVAAQAGFPETQRLDFGFDALPSRHHLTVNASPATDAISTH